MNFLNNCGRGARLFLLGLACILIGCTVILVGLSLVVGIMSALVFIVSHTPSILKSIFMFVLAGIEIVVVIALALAIGYAVVTKLRERKDRKK